MWQARKDADNPQAGIVYPQDLECRGEGDSGLSTSESSPGAFLEGAGD